MAIHNKILVGERHGKRVVIAVDPTGTSKNPRYQVRCDCGGEQFIAGTTFKESPACKACCPVGQPRKYGGRVMQNYKLYHTWIAMRRRCDVNVDKKRNERWAGRGITVCQEWQESFPAFESWAIDNGYEPGLSIDRINSDGNYEPSNCEFVTRSENSKRCRAEYKMVRIKDMDMFHAGVISHGIWEC